MNCKKIQKTTRNTFEIEKNTQNQEDNPTKNQKNGYKHNYVENDV